MASTIESQVTASVSRWENGYSIVRKGSVFELAFSRLDDAIACQNFLYSQFVFPDGFLLKPVTQVLTYYQFSVETIDWLESDMKKFIEFDFAPVIR